MASATVFFGGRILWRLDTSRMALYPLTHMTIVILGAITGESTGLLRVGLRVDVADFVALREAVEIT